MHHSCPPGLTSRAPSLAPPSPSRFMAWSICPVWAPYCTLPSRTLLTQCISAHFCSLSVFIPVWPPLPPLPHHDLSLHLAHGWRILTGVFHSCPCRSQSPDDIQSFNIVNLLKTLQEGRASVTAKAAGPLQYLALAFSSFSMSIFSLVQPSFPDLPMPLHGPGLLWIPTSWSWPRGQAGSPLPEA